MTSTTPTPSTTPTQPTTPQTTIDGYFECWNTTDPDRRAAAVARTWTEDATSSDPLSEVTGHDRLTAMLAGVQEQYPGHTFRQVGGFDAHHRYLRWAWEVVDPSGARVLDGIDVALLAEDGRLAHLAGFFGADIPAVAS